MGGRYRAAMAEVGSARRRLTTRKVVFLVIAAAAPLAAMVGNIPLALARGNGVGLPSVFLIAGIVLLCFSVGYAAFTKRVVNNGAFYTYIARALGKPVGIASAYAAVLAYSAMAMGLGAAFGYFTATVFDSLGIHVSWVILSAIAIAVTGVLGYRSVDVSAKVLGTLMVLEFVVLLVFDIVVIAKQGGDAFTPQSFGPSHVFNSALGVSLMFGFTSFIGFESAALYGEETKDPERSIPKSLYISVTTVGIFYLLTSWIIVGAAGGTQAAANAQAVSTDDLGDFVINLMQTFGGEGLYDLAGVLICTSVLASMIATHNAASRYLFVIGRERVMPPQLGTYHPKHLSPHVASLTVTAATVVVLGVMAIAQADPYAVAAASLIGLGTLGIIAVQAMMALAVVVYFAVLRAKQGRHLRKGEVTILRTVVAPVIAFVGLGAGFLLAAIHYDTLTDSDNRWVNAVPWLLVIAAFVGAGVTLWLRGAYPAAYHALAVSHLRKRLTPRPDDVKPTYTHRYCLVGGGPSGMVMARALMLEGVPFDWYERNTDFGGIWDIEAEGSPMYENAKFISSRYTSGFYGAPMSEDLPDYPSWVQIRDYIRDVARDYGLDEQIRFGTAVEKAELLPGDGQGDRQSGERWQVTLSTGETKVYDGLIAAPGVTWHPNRPTLAGEEEFRGEIRHSVTYRDPREFRGKRVLIVGAGNSGVDIACDAAREADQAFLSVRRGYRFIPKHIGNVPTDAVLNGYVDPPEGIVLAGDPNKLIDALVGDLTQYGLPAPDHDALSSHPIMNTAVLECLGSGELVAKPDIDHLTADGVVFADGSEEKVDLILLCTGYEYRLPFLDESLLTWKSGHPQLYLNVFSREVDSLYVLGFIEFADAAYKRFDEMAQLVTMDILARQTGHRRDEWARLKREDFPDLRGGMAYIDSPRHANYVESNTYQAYLAELRARFDWPDIDDSTYDALRKRKADR